MNSIHKLTTIILITIVLVLIGCEGIKMPFSKNKLEKVNVAPTEEKKIKLLGKLDKKFENPAAHYELGQLYKADGLWTRAEYHYNVALSFKPGYRKAQAAMVKTLMQSGDTAKAELSADIYINQVSASPTESLKLALAFQKQALDDYALSCYQQALRQAPNSPNINRQIGYYYLSKNQKQQAQDYLSRSFQLNPNQPDVAGELGRLGVTVRIPRKTTKNTKKLDKMVDKAQD